MERDVYVFNGFNYKRQQKEKQLELQTVILLNLKVI